MRVLNVGQMRCATFALALLACLGLWRAGDARAFGLTKWEAGTCSEESCKDSEGESSTKFYRQAAGHPDFGITDFRFAVTKHAGLLGEVENPVGHVKAVRVDLPPGLAVNPEATPTCEAAVFEKLECPGDTKIGEDEATGTASLLNGLSLTETTITERFPVFNIARKPGEPARFGVEVTSATLDAVNLEGHIYLEGGISWQGEAPDAENSHVPSGDYHEFFKIEDIPKAPELVESKLIFWGVPEEHTGEGKPTAFITLPSTCSEKPTTYLHVESYEEEGAWQFEGNTTPVTATGCASLAFNPSLSLSPETAKADQPDGLSATLHVPQSTVEPSKPNSPDLQDVQVTLPEGMTLDPSAANGLQACSGGEFAAGGCRAASQVGTVSINAPGIPPGALAGGVYVGEPEAGKSPESGGMYRLFVLASSSYGVGLRLEGRVSADAQTGRLTATFANAPQVPVEDFTLTFRGGPRAPLANPLSCGPVAPASSILPYGGEPAKAAAPSGFTVTGCPSPPFALGQSLSAQNAQAGAFSPFSFDLARADGEQYPSHLSTTLPPGLVGAIPSVPLCAEPQAGAGTCPSSSQIGTVVVAAGAGGEPYKFTGQAYLTGPYGGSPYGLSVVVPAVAGPYDLGNVVTRAGINVGLYSGRVIVTSTLPSIVGGVPLRLQSLSVDVNRANFAFNPTSCAKLSTETLLSSTLGASDSLTSPFQATGCGSLKFTPTVKAVTSAKASKPNGASLVVTVTQPAHQANISELQLQLPKQLVARFSTIQTSCPAATFESGPPPGKCASSARVGTASVTTPVLPGKLTGTAWFVSHGSEAFPDLDLVLSDGEVHVVLVGHTHIARSSITTSTFEDLPDVPISNVTVSLPLGANSALAAEGALCAAKLAAPTTIVAQNGAKITKSIAIGVSGCAVKVLSKRVRGHRLKLRLWVPEAGRVKVSAPGLRAVSVRVRGAGDVRIALSLPPRAMAAVRSHGRHALELRVAFTPKAGHNSSAVKLALR
ncbi:MAG TPA: hypothetical protein VGY13_00450 [Solirubrobacteraceae bacterium]|jgi:hypothetical protein|nr:hypothetical protein [Solirubrobacteraceae bacterium]